MHGHQLQSPQRTDSQLDVRVRVSCRRWVTLTVSLAVYRGPLIFPTHAAHTGHTCVWSASHAHNLLLPCAHSNKCASIRTRILALAGGLGDHICWPNRLTLYHSMQASFVDPSLSRFLSQDPSLSSVLLLTTLKLHNLPPSRLSPHFSGQQLCPSCLLARHPEYCRVPCPTESSTARNTLSLGATLTPPGDREARPEVEG